MPVMMGLRMAWHLFDNKFRLLALFKDKLWHRKWSVRSWASFLGYVPDERHINDFSLPTLVITGDKDGMLPLDYTYRCLLQATGRTAGKEMDASG